jgi:hypothetical protein
MGNKPLVGCLLDGDEKWDEMNLQRLLRMACHYVRDTCYWV